MLTFRHALRADQGGRRYQEDKAVVWAGEATSFHAPSRPPAAVDLVAVLADGMGGHAAGDVASATICEAFLAHVLATEGGAVPASLQAALAVANQTLASLAAGDRQYRGMGATCVGLTVGRDGAYWISVGDSPLWLWRAGELRRLNEDHSLAPMLDQLVADGRMDAATAVNDPRRHYLRSAVTGDELDLIDASQNPLALEAGDILLLASDGLLTLSEPDIQAVVAKHSGAAPGVLADALVEAVLSAGAAHQDNTTVIVLRVD
jgi:PPM family protein phosphatase